MRRQTPIRCAALLLAALLALPAFAATTKKAAAAKPAAVKPPPPDNLTAPSIRHVATCPPPKIAPCVLRKPVSVGYQVLTKGVTVSEEHATWLVDFGEGPKPSMFLLQVLDSAGSLHDIEVSFRTRAGMQKTPALPAE